jgi:hypothetical protein
MSHLPKVLAWLLSAASVRKFLEVGCITVDANFDGARSLTSQAKGKGQWISQIRAFVIPEAQLGHCRKETGAQFSKYGDIRLLGIPNCKVSYGALRTAKSYRLQALNATLGHRKTDLGNSRYDTIILQL